MKRPVVPGVEVGEPLGRGYAGAVFRGRTAGGAAVAVKALVLPTGAGDAGERRARFHREARIYHGVRHPALLRLYGLDLRADPPYLVLEFMPGGDLAGRVKNRGPLDPAALRRLATRLAGALDALHRAGVIHRDVKPSNVLYDSAGRAVLGDVGAGFLAAETRLTAADMAIGTPAYMAPEILRGVPASPASDLYSLGLTLVFAATGTRPKRRPGGGVDAGWEGGFPRGDPALVAVVRRCLRANPADRPATAAAVSEALASPVEPAGPPAAAPDPEEMTRSVLAAPVGGGVEEAATAARAARSAGNADLASPPAADAPSGEGPGGAAQPRVVPGAAGPPPRSPVAPGPPARGPSPASGPGATAAPPEPGGSSGGLPTPAGPRAPLAKPLAAAALAGLLVGASPALWAWWRYPGPPDAASLAPPRPLAAGAEVIAGTVRYRLEPAAPRDGRPAPRIRVGRGAGETTYELPEGTTAAVATDDAGAVFGLRVPDRPEVALLHFDPAGDLVAVTAAPGEWRLAPGWLLTRRPGGWRSEARPGP